MGCNKIILNVFQSRVAPRTHTNIIDTIFLLKFANSKLTHW